MTSRFNCDETQLIAGRAIKIKDDTDEQTNKSSTISQNGEARRRKSKKVIETRLLLKIIAKNMEFVGFERM